MDDEQDLAAKYCENEIRDEEQDSAAKYYECNREDDKQDSATKYNVHSVENITESSEHSNVEKNHEAQASGGETSSWINTLTLL